MSKLKEHRLIRTTYIVEECYVMAKDWEDAEKKGYLEAQEWEFLTDQAEIEAEEIDNIVNLNYERNIRHDRKNKSG